MDYDWDSIVVSKPELNSSQNFFRVRHTLHEKVGCKIKDVQIINKEGEKGVKKAFGDTNSKRRPASNADKENVQNNADRAILAVSLVTKKQTNDTQLNVKKHSILKNVLKKSLSVPAALTQKSQPAVQGAPAFKKPPTNIGQRQHAYAETIKKRKEELTKRVKQMEEKELKFKFRAKEAPKIHQKKIAAADQFTGDKKTVTKQNSLPTMSLPRKALSGFPSCGDPEKLKMVKAKREAMSNYKETSAPFKAKPAAVLTKQPFQPIIHAKAVVDQKPFKLQLTDRLIQRSEFDKKLLEKIAKRKEHEANVSRQQEMETRKLIRQKTEFKARPNPFGYH